MIEVEDLTKYYGGKRAISDLTFRIEKGEVVGFLGLNGAGKTTTLRILASLILPSSGRVRIDGLDTEADAYEIRKRLGFLADTPPLYDEMSVSDYLRFVAELKGVPGGKSKRLVDEAIGTCSLGDVRGQIIGTLSHGFKQRVGLAQAIVHKPSLLILDEPTGGLDPVQIVEMRELIKRLGGQHTILLSSHNLGEISQTCDRLLVIHQGQIIADGTEHSIKSRTGMDGQLTVLAKPCQRVVNLRRDAEATRIPERAQVPHQPQPLPGRQVVPDFPALAAGRATDDGDLVVELSHGCVDPSLKGVSC